jgi:hypothetical protein
MSGDLKPSLRERFSKSLWTLWIKPVVDYVTRVGELIVLAAAFKIAAVKSESMLLEVFSILLILACAAYTGIALGLLHVAIDSLRLKSWWLTRLILVALAVGMGVFSFHGSRQLSAAIIEIAEIQSND